MTSSQSSYLCVFPIKRIRSPRPPSNHLSTLPPMYMLKAVLMRDSCKPLCHDNFGVCKCCDHELWCHSSLLTTTSRQGEYSMSRDSVMNGGPCRFATRHHWSTRSFMQPQGLRHKPQPSWRLPFSCNLLYNSDDILRALFITHFLNLANTWHHAAISAPLARRSRHCGRPRTNQSATGPTACHPASSKVWRCPRSLNSRPRE
jgi:hypothetical protein